MSDPICGGLLRFAGDPEDRADVLLGKVNGGQQVIILIEGVLLPFVQIAICG